MEEGKRKRKRDKVMGNDRGKWDGIRHGACEEEDRGRKLGRGRRRDSDKQYKLFSELGISEPTAKAIRGRKHTHLTEVLLDLLHLKLTICNSYLYTIS
jgi:hypothetical protein